MLYLVKTQDHPMAKEKQSTANKQKKTAQAIMLQNRAICQLNTATEQND